MRVYSAHRKILLSAFSSNQVCPLDLETTVTRLVIAPITMLLRLTFLLVSLLFLLLRVAPAAAQNVDILTYHNNEFRTGWNPNETNLTPGNVDQNTFGKLFANDVQLDEQVDGQPLIVTNQTMQGQQSPTTVVYVVTEANTVYAVDSRTGKILIDPPPSLGPPVPTLKRLDCRNNGENVGTNSTPVINTRLHTLYVLAYVLKDGAPTYQLHALDLSTLAEQKGSPVTVSASINEGGNTFKFDPSVERQRPALLEAYGNIYAAFGSFCDKKRNNSRGWVLGWNKTTLAPISNGALTNSRTDKDLSFCTYPDNHPCFLSSIWMSGYGPAADDQGSIYFTTGNSAPGTFDNHLNLSESAVKLSSDLSLRGNFRAPPGDTLDSGDNDFGSGGILALPFAPIAFAAGKDGQMYVINTSDMTNQGSVPVDNCFCGPSFFVGEDGVARIVSSGGTRLKTWTIDTSQQIIKVTPEADATIAGPGNGFFTSISSDSTKAGTGIIWAVSGPVDADHHLTLYAFDAHPNHGHLTLLFSDNAGDWHNTGGNANIVPTVANGLVAVASYKMLRIFGPKSAHALVVAEAAELNLTDRDVQFWGTVSDVGDRTVRVKLRDGKMVAVDLTQALATHDASPVTVGDPVTVIGTKQDDGIVQATAIGRAKARSYWGADVYR